MNFAFAAGSDELATQSLYLSRSIRRYGNPSEVVVFIPSSERMSMPETVLQELQEHHTIVYGDIPIENYPISSKIQALVEAERHLKSRPILLLDTDIMVLNPPKFLSDADVGAVPVDIATDRYWATENSESDWQELYDHFDLPSQAPPVKTVVDKQQIRPYYNAGVVFSNSENFGEQWLDRTRDVLNRIENSPINADQIALGLLSREFHFKTIRKKFNYPVPHFLRFPSSIKCLHYHDLNHLARIMNPQITAKFRETGIYSETREYRTLRQLLVTRYGFKKPIKGRIGRALKRIRQS